MKSLLKFITASFATFLYIGCSQVKFGLDPGKCESAGQSCVVQNGLYHFDNVVSVGGGAVDVLIVDDNSASMSFEQKNLAARFSGFINQLEANSADYRIGITTTDVSTNASNTSNNYPRSINGNGALQDGNLISFSNGSSFLTPSSGASQSDRVSLFNQTLVRPETAKCEQFIANWVQSNGISSTNSSAYSQQYLANCPSGDERGIFAANLTVKNNPGGFIRANAHLAIIFLSDEDERSGLYSSSQSFALADNDQPNTLITNIRSTYGNDKSISVHAIVVKDNACLGTQNKQVLGNPSVAATSGFVNGSLGSAYLTFPAKGWGKAVDICFNDYAAQLGTISSSIVDRINGTTVACNDPQNLSVVIDSTDSTITWTRTDKDITFSKQLPSGTKVHLTYDCTSID